MLIMKNMYWRGKCFCYDWQNPSHKIMVGFSSCNYYVYAIDKL